MNTTPDELQKLVADYLRLRRSLGYTLAGTETLLLGFVAYLRDHGAQGLVPDRHR